MPTYLPIVRRQLAYLHGYEALGHSSRCIRQRLRAYNKLKEEWHVTMREEYDGFMETVSSGDPSRSRLLNTDQVIDKFNLSFQVHRLSAFPSRVALDAIFERLAEDHGLFMWDEYLVGKWNVIEKNGWIDCMRLIFVMDGYPRLSMCWKAQEHVWSQNSVGEWT